MTENEFVFGLTKEMIYEAISRYVYHEHLKLLGKWEFGYKWFYSLEPIKDVNAEVQELLDTNIVIMGLARKIGDDNAQ